MVLTFALIRAKSADKLPLYPEVIINDKTLLNVSIKTLVFSHLRLEVDAIFSLSAKHIIVGLTVFHY
ncbi:MAG: hypothetical protein ABSB71_06160 [Candidatus Bathyarchaeia archaeon]|jgi:hypothetical protein